MNLRELFQRAQASPPEASLEDLADQLSVARRLEKEQEASLAELRARYDASGSEDDGSALNSAVSELARIKLVVERAARLHEKAVVREKNADAERKRQKAARIQTEIQSLQKTEEERVGDAVTVLTELAKLLNESLARAAEISRLEGEFSNVQHELGLEFLRPRRYATPTDEWRMAVRERVQKAAIGQSRDLREALTVVAGGVK